MNKYQGKNKLKSYGLANNNFLLKRHWVCGANPKLMQASKMKSIELYFSFSACLCGSIFLVFQRTFVW